MFPSGWQTILWCTKNSHSKIFNTLTMNESDKRRVSVCELFAIKYLVDWVRSTVIEYLKKG